MKATHVAALAIILLSAVGAASYAARSMQPPAVHGTLVDPPLELEPFTLQGPQGPVRSDQFDGKLVVLTFGYTSCPDVCPMTMSRLARAMDLIGDASDRLQVLFVTVDPERDTPERTAAYAAAHDPSFLGLSGTEEQIAAVARQVGIYHAHPADPADPDHLVDHSATTLVLDRAGDLLLVWSFGLQPEQMADDLRTILR